MMSAVLGPADTATNGFTLIELLVYMSLSTIVLIITGGFMISSLTTERDVVNAANATNAAQLISTSVQAAVRNGSAVRATPDGFGNEMLTVRTRGELETFVCRAFFYSASDKAVYTKSSPSAIAAPTNPKGTWSLIGSGVTPVAGPGIFSSTSDIYASVNLDIAAGEGAPVRISTTASTRDTRIDALVRLPCFS